MFGDVFVKVVVVEIKVKVPAVFRPEISLLGEARKLATLAFGRTSEALAPVDKSGHLHHLEQVKLAFRRDVLHVFRHETGTETVLGDWRSNQPTKEEFL